MNVKNNASTLTQIEKTLKLADERNWRYGWERRRR